MVKKVIWSRRAMQQLAKAYEYILRNSLAGHTRAKKILLVCLKCPACGGIWLIDK